MGTQCHTFKDISTLGTPIEAVLSHLYNIYIYEVSTSQMFEQPFFEKGILLHSHLRDVVLLMYGMCLLPLVCLIIINRDGNSQFSNVFQTENPKNVVNYLTFR